VKFNLFGFKARMVGVALNHESNGKAILFLEQIIALENLNELKYDLGYAR
jgi:hypothetical protein